MGVFLSSNQHAFKNTKVELFELVFRPEATTTSLLKKKKTDKMNGHLRKTSNDTQIFYFFPRKKIPVSSLGFMWCPNSDI